jgi:hypothetical protein
VAERAQDARPVPEGGGAAAEADGAHGLGVFTFSLSRPVEQVLPRALISAADGKAYPIDPDFRTVLACLRRLNDPDMDALVKLLYLGKRFFLGQPPADMAALFTAFTAGGAAAASGEPPLMDFEQDAEAIYASFRMQYGIDLLTADLHWLAFRALLAGLGEDTPLGLRVRVRTLPDSRVAPEDRAQLHRLREHFAIAQRVSGAEQALLRALDEKLMAGEDPADVLAQLKPDAGG